MRSLAVVAASALLFAVPAGAQTGAPGCEFNVVGTWESTPTRDSLAEGGTGAVRYRFSADGTVATLRADAPGSPWREVPGSTFRYILDDPKAPSVIEFVDENGVALRSSMKIEQHDFDSFTTALPDGGSARWVRVDPHRYYAVFAGEQGTIRFGGPAFAMLVKTDGSDRQVDAVGFHLVDGKPVVGPIPEPLRKKFMSETRLDTESMLRVEVSPSEYARSLEVLKTWERRARENKMLYEVTYLNAIVAVEEIAKSLNKCGKRIALHPLTWNVDDKVIAKHNLPQVTYYYVKELRKLNDRLHVTDRMLEDRIAGR